MSTPQNEQIARLTKLQEIAASANQNDIPYFQQVAQIVAECLKYEEAMLLVNKKDGK